MAKYPPNCVAQRLHALRHVTEQAFGLGVAGKFEIFAHRHAKLPQAAQKKGASAGAP